MAQPEEPLPSYKDIDEPSPPSYPSDIAAEEARPIVASREDPPTYESVFGQIKTARTEHGNSFGFLKASSKIVAAAIGGIICVIMIAALLGLPIAQLIIGVQRKDLCPLNDKIPLFLTVSGAFGIVVGLMTILDQICCKKEDDEDGNPCVKFLVNMMNLFLFAWFICGNVWVYTAMKTVDYEHPLSNMYCDKVTYLFAFWSVTVVYVILGAACLLSCCACCLLMCVT